MSVENVRPVRFLLLVITAALGAVALTHAVTSESSAVVALPAFFLVGLSLGLAQSRLAFTAGLAFSAAPVILDGVKIGIDLAHDPTSHNLFPFELLVTTILGLIPASGLVSGFALRKLVSVPPRAAWVTAYSSVALAMLSPILSRAFELNTHTATVSTLKRLWQAETVYAADHQHRFTCEGPLLPGFERERWFASTQLGLTTKDHMQGRGGYWFTVRCGDLSRGDHLYIDADPGPGGIVYCTDETGVIYSVPFKNGTVCGP
jgi:hypothetical protein